MVAARSWDPPFRAHLSRCMMSAVRDTVVPGFTILTMEAVFMRKWRPLFVFAMVALCLGLLLGAEPALAQKKTLVVALYQDPALRHPPLARTYDVRIILDQTCAKRYATDQAQRIRPPPAADPPTVSHGGKTVTIKLRPNVKFNDGTPMNAEAVRYSLD